jgi:hypothetical protein
MADVFTLEDLARAKRWALAQRGDPYVWGGDGPDGWDCSGFMGGIHQVLKGEDGYNSHQWGTGTIREHYSQLGWSLGKGDSNDFTIGVIYPWESSSGIGHTAGTIDGLNVESRGGQGVLVGSAARGANNPLFRHHFHVKITSQEDDFMALFDNVADFEKAVWKQVVLALRAAVGPDDASVPAGAYFERNESKIDAILARPEVDPGAVAVAVVAAAPDLARTVVAELVAQGVVVPASIDYTKLGDAVEVAVRNISWQAV